MTLEELFVEKYKDLENENAILNHDNYELKNENKELEEKIEAIKQQLYKLKDVITIRTSSDDNSRFMDFDHYIYENQDKELFDFLYYFKVSDYVIDLSEVEEKGE